MDEYTASRAQVQTIINAAQSMRECLTCSICLDYLEKPVKIKCGHKFCQGCILGVANNDNASCPLCNTKFQKRSVHKESNEQLELCVQQFKALAKAIHDDSGINVLEPCHRVKHSKESVFPKSKPSTSRVEQASTSSKGSINSKVLASSKGALHKKTFTPKIRTAKSTKNTLHRYLSAKASFTPDDEMVGSQDKVENWLKHVEPTDVENEVINNANRNIIEDTDNEAISNPEDLSLTKHECENQLSKRKSCFTEMKENYEKPFPHTYPSTSNSTTKYKETEMRIQEAEIMAKKKKVNQGLTDRAILKTPSSVPAASHSDAHDWRRVKRVGKEMQVKTFKSLNVSKEKSSSSIVLDDTVPCNVKTPERTRTDCDVSNPEITPKPLALSPSQINTNPQLQENELSGGVINPLNSPSKRKLSLKVKLSDSASSKSSRSQISTPDRTQQSKMESPIKITPDRPKSRLSLRLQTSKPAEHKLSQQKSPNKNQNPTNTNKSKPARSPNSKIVLFRKLGRICKKRKFVPFNKLGRLCPKIIAKKTSVKIISSENVNVDISCIKAERKAMQISNKVKMLLPEEDSQLKYFTEEVSSSVQQVSKRTLVDESALDKCVANETHQTIMPMEIDESLPNVTIFTSQKKELENKKTMIDRDKAHIETVDYEPVPSTSKCQKPEKGVNEHKFDHLSSETYEKVTKHICQTNIDDHGKSKKGNVKKCKKDKNVEHLENKNMQKNLRTVKVQDDAISISSNDSESRNLDNGDTSKRVDAECIIDLENKNRYSKPDSVTSESSLIYMPKRQEKFSENKSVCSSRSSSPLMASPLKKKRTHSESSNDDDDDDVVSSIIDKWTNEKPVIKKPKVIEDNRKDLKGSTNKLNQLEISDSNDNEKTLVEDQSKQLGFIKPQRDPPIDDIISKVKSFKEHKQDDYSVNKLTGLPSSLQSADLFESNDLSTRLKVEVNKQSNEITSDNSSISTRSPYKQSDNENIVQNFETMGPQLEATIVDMLQFDRKKSNSSVCSNSSNKENNACNKVNTDRSNMENRVNKVENSPKEILIAEQSQDSPLDSYYVPDTLMNITQEQLALKMIEKDLIGADLSTMNNNENQDFQESDKFATPRRKVANLPVVNNNDDDFDSESIDATPVAKRRQIFSKYQSKSTTESEINSSEKFSPEKSLHLIPAVTPMRNRKSYPLCHSTPMLIDTLSPEKQSRSQRKPMALICSGLSPANIKIVQNFANKFNATFLSAFNNIVTHVIVATDPETKSGQKTFKYIQGIAFKKYVISFQWILDCLDKNAILDEDDEKYDVLDPDIFECGSKKSRNRVQDLFANFAFFCLEPFNSIQLADFKSLLVSNGAAVTATVEELCLRKDKYRIIILESEEMSPKKLATLKKQDCVIVSFEWVVDSLSQYEIVSLFAYFYETSPEKALAVGFPSSYLKEEEEVEEEEE